MSNKSDLLARLAAIREINPELKYTRQEMENRASKRKHHSLFLQLQPSPSAQPQAAPRATLPSTVTSSNNRFVGLNVDFFRNSIILAGKETDHQEGISSVQEN